MTIENYTKATKLLEGIRVVEEEIAQIAVCKSNPTQRHREWPLDEVYSDVQLEDVSKFRMERIDDLLAEKLSDLRRELASL